MEDLFQLDTHWFAQFCQLFTSGEVAKMGATSFTVYSCIKAYANYATGQAFPSLDTISEKTGVSKRQVTTCLQHLESLGYLKKDKLWKKNIYTLREQMQFTDKHGTPVAQASFDYIPALLRQATAELKNYKMTGDANGFNVVHIDKLVIENINIVQGDQINVNVQASLDSIKDATLRERVRSLMSKAIASSETSAPEDDSQGQ
jgi:hypothetical protein